MKYIITMAVLAISIQSFGQFARGDKALGGAIYLDLTDNGTAGRNNSINFSPTFGLFLSPNLEAGARLLLSRSYYVNDQNNWKLEGNRSNMQFGLYIRKYFSLSDKFLFTLSGGIGYGHGTEWYTQTYIPDNQVTENESENNSVELAISPGFIFLPTAHWGLQVGLGNIRYTFTKYDGGGKGNNFNLNYGSVGLGVVYYFRKSE